MVTRTYSAVRRWGMLIACFACGPWAGTIEAQERCAPPPSLGCLLQWQAEADSLVRILYEHALAFTKDTARKRLLKESQAAWYTLAQSQDSLWGHHALPGEDPDLLKHLIAIANTQSAFLWRRILGPRPGYAPRQNSKLSPLSVMRDWVTAEEAFFSDSLKYDRSPGILELVPLPRGSGRPLVSMLDGGWVATTGSPDAACTVLVTPVDRLLALAPEMTVVRIDSTLAFVVTCN